MATFTCPNCSNRMDQNIQKCAYCQWFRGDPKKYLFKKWRPKTKHWAGLIFLYLVGAYGLLLIKPSGYGIRYDALVLMDAVTNGVKTLATVLPLLPI